MEYKIFLTLITLIYFFQTLSNGAIISHHEATENKKNFFRKLAEDANKLAGFSKFFAILTFFYIIWSF